MTAERHSPLEHLAADMQAASTGDVSLREVPFLAQIGLRAGAAAAAAVGAALGRPLPTVPNIAAASGERSALWLGPDEWLLVGPPGDERALAAELEAALAGTFGSVVDLSANRTVLELAGPGARDVLMRGCALDLHPRAFAPGRCAQTLLARAQVILHADADERWRIFVRGSFSDYLAAWLLDAMAELRRSDALSAAGEPASAGASARSAPPR